jgi:hypothetical protein
MKLRFIHPDAKAGGTVRIPGFRSAPIAYGEDVEFSADMVDAALASGNWEKVTSSAKNTLKAEPTPEDKPAKKESN